MWNDFDCCATNRENPLLSQVGWQVKFDSSREINTIWEIVIEKS